MPSPNQTKPNQSHNLNTLWLGFAFGAVAAGSIAFLLGTKKGREFLKKLLEISEDLQENAMVIAEQIEEAFSDKDLKSEFTKQTKPILGNLLDKMKLLRN